MALISFCLLVLLPFAAMATDVLPYSISQTNCEEVTEGRTNDCRWPAGLYADVDQLVKKGRIIAYQIRWSTGGWSGWYVPGVNDFDTKFNPAARTCSLPYLQNSVRRMWSYFYDHTHKYIICKNTPMTNVPVQGTQQLLRRSQPRS